MRQDHKRERRRGRGVRVRVPLAIRASLLLDDNVTAVTRGRHDGIKEDKTVSGKKELADEALDAVSGGVYVTGTCDECHKKKQVMLYLYEKQGQSRLLCRDCIADIKKAKK